MLQGDRADLATEQSLDSRLKAIVERAARQVGAAHALLLLRAHDTSELRNAAWYGCQEAPEALAAVARQVLSREVTEASKTGGYSLDKSTLPIVCVPVMSNATPQGVLAVGWLGAAGDGRARWFPLLESLAALAGALLENEALQKDVSRKEEQVRDLVRETLEAQEKERERICLEVHDGVAQTLASAFQHLQALGTAVTGDSQARQLLLRATALVKQAIQESREVINSLQPAALIDLGLVATLRQEMRQLEQETGWEVDFEADAIRLPKSVETGLYRLIHEAITNARKHSHTQRLCVRLTSADDRLKVEVRDWGVGFYLPPVDRRRAGKRRDTGLLSMRKRAELLQGLCDIQASPGQGTAVRVDIPLRGYTEQHG